MECNATAVQHKRANGGVGATNQLAGECHPPPSVRTLFQKAEAEAIAHNVSALGPQKVHAVLGFNEPNAGSHEPLITVTDAVAAWKTWFEPIARQRNATYLVSPSAAHCACDGINCSGGGGANSPTGYCDENWIHKFMRSCHTCRIDAIGVHWYPFFRDYNDTIDPCAGANLTVCVDHFISHLKTLTVYGKPLWITEFCAPTIGRMPDTDAPRAEVPFLRAALKTIEEMVPEVHRIAPFSARIGGADFAGCTMFEMHPVFGQNLTAAGEVYAAWRPSTRTDVGSLQSFSPVKHVLS